MSGDEDVSGLDGRAFDALEDEVERLAAESARGVPAEERERQAESEDSPDRVRDEDDFERIVKQAIDELPSEYHRALEGVAVVVSDDGHERNWYGEYTGRKLGHTPVIGSPDFYVVPDQIVIFRDTLLRDFGHDPALLRAQITRTVRHEVGHRLGFDERGVRRLGL